jgi:hypothetical protein
MNKEQFEHRAYKYLLGDLALEIFHLKHILKGTATIEYIPFQSSVIASNDAFLTLWNNHQKTAALAFVRVLSEHLVYLYAELLYPERIISKVYLNEKELDDIRVKREKIKPKDIRDEVAKAYKDFGEIWNSYHYFIHPNYLQGTALPLEGAYEKGYSDMIKLNNWIIDTLTKIKGRYKRELKAKGLYQKYLDYLNEKEPD